MNAKHIPFALVFVLTATGCGASAAMAPVAPSSMPGGTRAEAAPAAEMPADVSAKGVSMPAPASHGASSAKTNANPGATKQVQAENPDVLIVYNGDVIMSVDSDKVSSTIDHIIDLGESVGGHLAGRRDTSVTIRVPSARFHEALQKVAAFGEVTHQSVAAEDVSAEFHDAEVRLQNLKAAQRRLQDFLSKASNLNNMLTLERELERISMEIDRVEGRMRFLKDHAAFSTLSVAITPRPKTQPIVATPGKPLPSAPPRILPLHVAWLDQLGVPSLVNN